MQQVKDGEEIRGSPFIQFTLNTTLGAVVIRLKLPLKSFLQDKSFACSTPTFRILQHLQTKAMKNNTTEY